MRLSSSLASARHSACGLFQWSFIGKFAHILSHCVHSLFTVAPSLNDSKEQKTLLSCSLCTFPFLSFPYSPIPLFFFSSQTGIGQSTINLFLQRAEAQQILAGLEGGLPSLGVFNFFYLQGRKDVSSLAEKYAFVGCRRLVHCRSFGNKPGWLYSPGLGPLFLLSRNKQVPFKFYCLAFYYN